MPALFGAKLEYLRKQCMWTQAELARELGVSRAYVNNAEAGRRGPTLKLVLRVADRLGVTTDYLLRDTILVEDMAPSFTVSAANLRSSLQQIQLFGRKLRYLRSRHHVTQSELVQHLNFRSQSHVSLMEVGQNEPSIEMVLRLAELFGVTTDYLLQDTIPIEITDGQGDSLAS